MGCQIGRRMPIWVKSGAVYFLLNLATEDQGTKHITTSAIRRTEFQAPLRSVRHLLPTPYAARLETEPRGLCIAVPFGTQPLPSQSCLQL